MELLYLWIEDFRNIKKQGFNFSAEFRFEVREKESSDGTDDLAYDLSIVKNIDFVSLFDSNITNVTGIVGENGTGKSNLLDCLKLLFGKIESIESSLIFCLRDLTSRIIKTYYCCHHTNKSVRAISLTISNVTLTECKGLLASPQPYSIIRNPQGALAVKGLDGVFGRSSLVFFSNTFDNRLEYSDGILNVSTNSIIDEVSQLRDKVLHPEDANVGINNRDLIGVSIRDDVSLRQTKNLIEFISYANTQNKNSERFQMPEEVKLDFRVFDISDELNEKNTSNGGLLINLLEQQLACERLLMNKKGDTNVFLALLLLSMISQKLDSGDWKITELNLNIPGYMTIEDLDSSIILNNVIKSLNRLFIDELDHYKIDNSKSILGSFFVQFMGSVEWRNIGRIEKGHAQYNFEINRKIWPLLDWIARFEKYINIGLVRYEWIGGMSSGQLAFLNHFAMFYSLMRNVQSKSLIILVDEGDLYFHPEWQRSYFSNLLSYLVFIFPTNSIQIILTTHSPFITSDLPKQNLIFLKKNEQSNCLVTNNEIQIETFGGNIHELFTNSFFLADGLIGEFARTKIKELIDEITLKESISKDEFENNYKKRVAIIGEKFIQSKLFEMIASKTENEVIDKIIDFRNEEIERLKILKQKKKK